MDETEIHQVTKPKSEGRVAAGKRLAEWNHKNKENFLKNQMQVNSSENAVPNPADLRENQVLPSPSWKYSGLEIILPISGGAAAYLFYKPKPVEAQPPNAVTEPKIYWELNL